MKKYFPHILFILLVAVGIFAFSSYAKLKALRLNPQQIAQEEMRELVKVVGKLYVLPADEDPTIATVKDPEALKEQPFFAKAQVGFKVLIYPVAKKAVLFDPVGKKIVEVAPVTIGEKASTSASAPVTQP